MGIRNPSDKPARRVRRRGCRRTRSRENLVCAVFIAELRSVALSRFLQASFIVSVSDYLADISDGFEVTHEFDGYGLIVEEIRACNKRWEWSHRLDVCLAVVR